MTRRRKLLFTLVVQVVLLGLAEAGVRIHTLVSGGVPPTADRSLEREWMWARRHLEAGSAVLPGEHVFDPQLGWRNAPDLDTALVRTNAAGMRNTNDFEPGRGSRPRIAFLGDSYTFGPFVTNEASFVGRVGAALPDHDVLNFGVNGYGTDQAQLTYELHARTYRPDVVVMGYFVRDYTRNLVTFTDYAKPRFELGDGELRLVGSPVEPPESLFEAYRTGARRIGPEPRSQLLGSIARGLSRQRRHSMDPDAEGWRVLSALMARFAERAREDGAVPVWLVIPARDKVGGASRFDPLAARCAGRAEGLGLACCDAGPWLAEAARSDPGTPLYRPQADGGHLSAEGNAALAACVLDFLRKQVFSD